MADPAPPAVLVLGVGNALRGDDGVGVVIARRLGDRPPAPGVRVRDGPGEMAALLEAWQGCDGVVLVDAMRSGAVPGTVCRFDVTSAPLPRQVLTGAASSHAAGLGPAVELARALGRLPARAVVYAVEGRCFDLGAGLSPAVSAAVPALGEAAWAEACRLADRSTGGARPLRGSRRAARGTADDGALLDP